MGPSRESWRARAERGGESDAVRLLPHGRPQTHLTWHKIAPRWVERFTVVVPDLRGYGDSAKPEGGERYVNCSKRAMVADQVYFWWFLLIQPEPLPERLIGADPEF